MLTPPIALTKDDRVICEQTYWKVKNGALKNRINPPLGNPVGQIAGIVHQDEWTYHSDLGGLFCYIILVSRKPREFRQILKPGEIISISSSLSWDFCDEK